MSTITLGEVKRIVIALPHKLGGGGDMWMHKVWIYQEEDSRRDDSPSPLHVILFSCEDALEKLVTHLEVPPLEEET